MSLPTHENVPLSTFNSIFRDLLKKNGIEQQRYGWSLKKGEEFLNSIMNHFKQSARDDLISRNFVRLKRQRRLGVQSGC